MRPAALIHRSIALCPGSQTPIVHKVQKLLGRTRRRNWNGLTSTLHLGRNVEKRLVLVDRAAERTPELVADKVVYQSIRLGVARLPVVGCQLLNALVLKNRSMPFV